MRHGLYFINSGIYNCFTKGKVIIIGSCQCLRFRWSIALLTIAMLLAGGVVTMEYATLIFALPVTFIAYLVMASFYKALRIEQAEREGHMLRKPSMAPSGGHVPERSWKQRLGQLLAFPSKRDVTRFLDRTVRPALDDVAAEFRRQGYEVGQEAVDGANHIEGPLLRVGMNDLQVFHYQVAMVEAPMPTFSGKAAREGEAYYRLEVFTQTGSGGYDLMGLTRQQVIDDVLERYEAHLASLTASVDPGAVSLFTPPMPSKEQHPTMPKNLEHPSS